MRRVGREAMEETKKIRKMTMIFPFLNLCLNFGHQNGDTYLETKLTIWFGGPMG